MFIYFVKNNTIIFLTQKNILLLVSRQKRVFKLDDLQPNPRKYTDGIERTPMSHDLSLLFSRPKY